MGKIITQDAPSANTDTHLSSISWKTCGTDSPIWGLRDRVFSSQNDHDHLACDIQVPPAKVDKSYIVSALVLTYLTLYKVRC